MVSDDGKLAIPGDRMTSGQLILDPCSATYSGSAPGIASVSKEGVVTGIAPGTATITTTVTHGGVTQVATSVTVAVTPPRPMS